MTDYTDVFGIRVLDPDFYAAHASNYTIVCNDAVFGLLSGKIVLDDVYGDYLFVEQK